MKCSATMDISMEACGAPVEGPILTVDHLSKNFGTHIVLRDINLHANVGDVVSIIARFYPHKILTRFPRLLTLCSRSDVLLYRCRQKGTANRPLRKGALIYGDHNGLLR